VVCPAWRPSRSPSSSLISMMVTGFPGHRVCPSVQRFAPCCLPSGCAWTSRIDSPCVGSQVWLRVLPAFEGPQGKQVQELSENQRHCRARSADCGMWIATAARRPAHGFCRVAPGKGNDEVSAPPFGSRRRGTRARRHALEHRSGPRYTPAPWTHEHPDQASNTEGSGRWATSESDW